MGATLTDRLFVFADPREGERLIRRGLPAAVLGVGKVAAATSLARQLAATRPGIVVLVGVAGAYPERHRATGPRRTGHPTEGQGRIGIGEILVVGESVLADEGVQTEQAFLDLEELGLGPTGPFRADPPRTERLAALVGHDPVRAATVSACAGCERLSALRAGRFDAELETMESAAVVAVCQAFGVPVVELRCVSNWTGDRDRGEFALADAANRMQQQILTWVDSGDLDRCLR